MKIKHIFSTILIACAGLFIASSCQPEEVFLADIDLSESTLNFEAEGGTQSITVTCNTPWTVSRISGDGGWFTFTPTACDQTSGTATFTVTVDPIGDEERTATLIFNTKDDNVFAGLKIQQLKEDPTRIYKKASVFQDGKSYLIVAEGLAFAPFSGNYGYNYGEGVVEDSCGDQYTLPDNRLGWIAQKKGDGFTLLGSDGRYLYMAGSYNSFNVSANPPENDTWKAEPREDGTVLITNIGTGKFMQFSVNYSSYGCYPGEQDSGVYPYLYEDTREAGPIVLPDFLTVSPASIEVGADAGTASFTVSANIPWTVSCDADWVTSYTKSGENEAAVQIEFAANEDMSAGRTATFTVEGNGLTATVTLAQDKKADGSIAKIADAFANNIGENVTVQGVVTGQCTRGYILTDDSGSALVYTNSECEYEIGTELKITAKATVYNFGAEFGTPTSTEVISTGKYEYPQPEVIDGAAAEAAIAATADKNKSADLVVSPYYAEMRGTLSISGSYFNLILPDSESAQGSIYYPISGIVGADSALNGQDVVVRGWFIAISGGKYINMVATYVGPASEDPDVISVEEAFKSLGEVSTVKGVVTAMSAKGFIVTDDSGSALVYTNAAPDCAVGDVVKVKAKAEVYNFGAEFTSPEYEVVSSVEYNYPQAVVIDAVKAEELVASIDGKNKSADLVVKPYYAELNGTLVQSGNYYNIIIDGTDKAQGSLYQPISEFTDKYADLVDKQVVLKGFFCSISGGKYINLVATSFEEAVVDQTVSVAAAFAKVGEVSTVQGQVTSVCKKGFIVTDETGSALVYTNAAPECALGDIVKVEAKAEVYNFGAEFTSPAVEVIGKADLKYPEAVLIDAAKAEEIIASTDGKNKSSDLLVMPYYAELVGTLVQSGNYYNIIIEGTDKAQGSIYQPDTDITDKYADLVDKQVVLTGYFSSISGGKYVNIVATSFKEYTDGTVSVAAAFDKLGEVATVKGQVTAVCKKGFIVTDKSGSALVYTNAAPECSLGDLVKVEAKAEVYNFGAEFTSPAVEVIGKADLKYPEAVLIDAAKAEEIIASIDGKNKGSDLVVKPYYAELVGTLVQSGNYYNIIIEGTDKAQGSIYQPDTDITDKYADLVDKKIVLKGYLNSVSGGKYLYLVGTSFAAAE